MDCEYELGLDTLLSKALSPDKLRQGNIIFIVEFCFLVNTKITKSFALGVLPAFFTIFSLALIVGARDHDICIWIVSFMEWSTFSNGRIVGVPPLSIFLLAFAERFNATLRCIIGERPL